MESLANKAKALFKHGNFEQGVLKVVFVYAIVSALYIWLSDSFVSLLFKEPEKITQVSILKGWLFVGLTTLLLYVLVKRLLHRVLVSQAAEHKALEELSTSEAIYRSLTEQVPAIIYRANVNDVSSNVYVSPKVRELGYTLEEWLSSPESWMERIHPEDRPLAIKALEDAHRNKTGFSCEYRLRAKNGEWRIFHDEAVYIEDEHNHINYLQGIMWDITERKAIESRMRQLSQAIEQSPVNTIITNLDGNIEYVNKAFEINSGYTAAEVLGKNPGFRASHKTPKSSIEALWNSLRQGKVWHGSFINLRKDGTEYVEQAVVAPVRDDKGNITHYLSVQQDITLQKKAEEEAYRLANYDTLTGLANRNLLISHLSQHLSSAQRQMQNDILMLINIDHFKHLNDARGHRFGDDVLKSVAQSLMDLNFDQAMIARYGGDEFAIHIHHPLSYEGTMTHHAATIVGNVSKVIMQPFNIQGTALHITASIGVILFPEANNDTALTVLKNADTALHIAKQRGGNQTVFFESPMAQAVEKYYQIERDLHDALHSQQLQLYFQSQVNASAEIVGAEALLRWKHPEQGFIPPNIFIPVAEDSNLITQIDHFVLHEVCKLLVSPRLQTFQYRISVNISPRTFRQHTFTDSIKQMLSIYGLSGDRITLEVTEGMVLNNVEEVIQKMKMLSSLGIHFSIDDFGTGFSSLAYLKKLPVHELKIDKTFVQDAPTNQSDEVLIDAILAVAQKLDLRVVAEGVETEAQSVLLNAKAEVVQQGYLFSRPQPIDSWLLEINCVKTNLPL